MPGARRHTMVAMKLTEPRVVLKPGQDQSHRPQVAPGAGSADGAVQGRVGEPAEGRRAARHEEAGDDDEPAEQVEPVGQRVQPGERHVGRPDLQGHHGVGEPRERRRREQQHHDRAVDGDQLVVLGVAPQLEPGAGEFGPHAHGEQPGEEEETEGGHEVHVADDLVVRGGEEVQEPSAQRAAACRSHRRPAAAVASVPVCVMVPSVPVGQALPRRGAAGRGRRAGSPGAGSTSGSGRRAGGCGAARPLPARARAAAGRGPGSGRAGRRRAAAWPGSMAPYTRCTTSPVSSPSLSSRSSWDCNARHSRLVSRKASTGKTKKPTRNTHVRVFTESRKENAVTSLPPADRAARRRRRRPQRRAPCGWAVARPVAQVVLARSPVTQRSNPG